MGSVSLMAQALRKEDEPVLRRALQDRTRDALLRAVADGTAARVAIEQFSSRQAIRK
jgi:hypothetical protein